MRRRLNINDNALFKVKIESIDELKDSFFKPEYIKASNELIGIVNQSQKGISSNDFNNIIAFVGERGTGKTSAMISFKEVFCNENNIDIKDDDELFKNINKLRENKWNYIDIVDPSVLSSKDSIIEVIIGNMFKNFKIYEGNRDFNQKHGLVKAFERVYKDLKILNKPSKYRDSEDNLEKLLDLSSAVALKSNMSVLIEEYLKYMNKGEIKDVFLIIPIDDIDMNLQLGMEMLEDIRKYLMIPNVVILMAVKMEQLEEVVTQKHIKELKDYKKEYIEIKDKFEKNDFYNEINNKTEKYLEKTIPYTRRIMLPYLDDGEHDLILKGKFNSLQDKNIGSDNNIKSIIKKILFNRAQYIIGTDKHYQAIVPRTLRGFILFLDLLSNMEGSKEQVDYINNLAILKEYYRNVLIKEVGNYEQRGFLQEISSCKVDEVNRKILLYTNNILYRMIGEKFDKDTITSLKINKNLFVDVEEFEKRSRLIKKNNISLGYIVTWLRALEVYSVYKNEYKFIEMVKFIYSIRLLEVYNSESNEGNQVKNIIKNDLLGRFLEIENYKESSKFQVEVSKRATREHLALFSENPFKVDKNKEILKESSNKTRYYINSVVISEITGTMEKNTDEELKDIEIMKNMVGYIDIIFSLFEPKYNSDGHSNGNDVLYRSDIDILNIDDKYKNSNYVFKAFSIIGFLVNEDENRKQLLSVINIDFFMNILVEFSQRVSKARYGVVDAKVAYKIIESCIIRYNEVVEYITKESGNEFILYDKLNFNNERLEFIKKNIYLFFYEDLQKYIEKIRDDLEVKKKELNESYEDGAVADIKTKSEYNKIVIAPIKKIIKEFLNSVDKKGMSQEIIEIIKKLEKAVELKQISSNQHTKINYQNEIKLVIKEIEDTFEELDEEYNENGSKV